jgi:hypothetical protein
MSAAQEPVSCVHKTIVCRQIIPLSGDLSGHDPDAAIPTLKEVSVRRSP